MDVTLRIERALATALTLDEGPDGPPKLREAVRHAVFPGGARVRPKLCLSVAAACGDGDPVAADAVGCAIEFLHCASLVHDDLPCFDDAATRRGRPSVHKAFGEPLAVLAGDALIVLAFETLARGAATHPALGTIVRVVGRSVGSPHGIVAGQAWESEPDIDRVAYHRAKTGALFAAATAGGAAAAGADPDAWQALGERVGEAFQVADDIRDAAASEATIGKPVGRDLALGRPSAVRDLGVAGAVVRLKSLVAEAMDSVPPCIGAALLRKQIFAQAQQFLPPDLMLEAA
jgi:geranylgeranyl diphosphate synthase type II